MFAWLFDQCLSVAVAAVNGIDTTAFTGISGWGSVPSEVMNVLSLAGRRDCHYHHHCGYRHSPCASTYPVYAARLMINGLEGIPGSGKSYEAVVYHVLEALKRGRMVITNLPLVVPLFAALDPSYAALIEVRTRPAPVRGTWDANRMDEQGNGNAFLVEGASVPAAGLVSIFGHVWDYYSEWKHPRQDKGHCLSLMNATWRCLLSALMFRSSSGSNCIVTSMRTYS